MIKWVLIKKYAELVGSTENAIRINMKRGIWREGTHWKKAPNNRIYCNIEALELWIEGKVN